MQVFLPILILQVFGLISGINQDVKTAKPGSPNVILILVDDLGYQDVGFNGCTDIPTPHIDRIATEGVKFTNGYVSYAVCGPSRAGLITGRYQDRFGFGRNPLFAPNDPTMGLPKTEETLAEALQKANYKSVAIGKWHLGAHESLRPLNRGFDDFFGFLTGGHRYFPEEWTLQDEYDITAQYEAYRTKLLRNTKRIEEKEYLTDALSREAVNYIEQYKDQPFFMYLAYNAPHTPLQATEKYLSRFEHLEPSKRKTYAAMVSAVDDGVGRILDKLENLNIDDHTLIIFLSDNGGPERKNGSNNGPLRGRKGDLLEGGIRVPFAMRWPDKIDEGTIFNKPVISLDIFATVIAHTEQPVTTKNKLDGVDLLPYLNGDIDEAPHEYLFWRKFDKRQYAVRDLTGDKIIASEKSVSLFNLKTNISEAKNQILQDQKRSQNLNQAYKEWNAQMLAPTFLGLGSDSLYSHKHPNRFKQID